MQWNMKLQMKGFSLSKLTLSCLTNTASSSTIQNVGYQTAATGINVLNHDYTF